MPEMIFKRSNTTLFVALLVIVFVSANADVAEHDTHPNVCFKKYRTCCYTYGPCGYVDKKVEVAPRCDYKKCTNVCKPVCKLVPHKHPKKTCAYSKHEDGEKCGKFLTYNLHKPVVTSKCFPVYHFKKDCYEEYDLMYKEVCDKVCAPICTLEKAICTKYDVYRYVKYCPKHECSDFKFDGTTEAPKGYVGKESKFLKEIAGKRETLGEKALHH